jgi:hypothetical protein
VRAATVATPALCRWSSDRANALGEPAEPLKPDLLDLGLGDTASRSSLPPLKPSSPRLSKNYCFLCWGMTDRISPL